MAEDVTVLVSLDPQQIAAMVQEVQLPFRHLMVPDKPIFAARSGHWPKAREDHLAKFPTCAVCGGDQNLQVHHIRPYHLHPELELDPDNLLTLCEPSAVIHINCHLIFGHLDNWHSYCLEVRQIAAEFLKQLKNRKFK